jgi:acyl dehydratase
MIIDFALAYDPQPFHLDSRAATASYFGGLVAIGIQTLAPGFRAFLQLGLFSACGLGSPGLDKLRWLHPVRPGDTLHSEVEVVNARPSRSNPDRGILVIEFRGRKSARRGSADHADDTVGAPPFWLTPLWCMKSYRRRLTTSLWCMNSDFAARQASPQRFDLILLAHPAAVTETLTLSAQLRTVDRAATARVQPHRNGVQQADASRGMFSYQACHRPREPGSIANQLHILRISITDEMRNPLGILDHSDHNRHAEPQLLARH